jgi:hypothetical protein
MLQETFKNTLNETQRQHHVGENWDQQNFHSLLVEMQNGTATLEDSLAGCYKNTNVLLYDPVLYSFVFTQNDPKNPEYLY